MKNRTLIFAAIAASWTTSSPADWVDARCDIYPKGSDHASKMIPCTFSQRQGYITITRDDGVTHDLSPLGETPGNFRDQEGHPAYRQSGLGEQFTINFMSDYINAANREVEAVLEGDTWTVTVDDSEVYEVPLAAIEGG